MAQQQLTIRLDSELYGLAKKKCKDRFGIGLSPLIKVFLKSFVTQGGVGFYVGDDDLCKMFNNWLVKKSWEQKAKGRLALPGPRLKDLYSLNPSRPQIQI